MHKGQKGKIGRDSFIGFPGGIVLMHPWWEEVSGQESPWLNENILLQYRIIIPFYQQYFCNHDIQFSSTIMHTWKSTLKYLDDSRFSI